MKNAYKTAISLFDSPHSDDGTDYNKTACSAKDSEDGISSRSIIKKYLWVKISIDSDSSHGKANQQDKNGAEAGKSFHASNHSLMIKG